MTTTTHADRARPLQADSVKIGFGPEVRKDLTVLANALKDKDDFDPSVHQMVMSMSTGAPTDLTLAVTQLAMVVRDTAEYAARKRDPEVKEALDDVIGDLVPGNARSNPIQVTVETRGRVKIR